MKNYWTKSSEINRDREWKEQQSEKIKCCRCDAHNVMNWSEVNVTCKT